jgi:hypothetical protein
VVPVIQLGQIRERLSVGHRHAAPSGGVPTVYYAYDTDCAPIATSVDLSKDGTQLAFITGASGSPASLVVLRTAK